MKTKKLTIWLPVTASAILCAGFAGVRLAARDDAKSAHAELLRQENLARAAGIPLTPAEFAPHPAIPDSQNAASLYRKAAAILTKAYKMPGVPGDFGVSNADIQPDLQADQAYLAKIKPALALIARGAQRPYCDLHLKQTDIGFPEFAQFKVFARVAAGEAALKASEGKPIQALESLAKYAPSCGHLAQTHTMISGLVQVAVDAIFTKEIDFILAHYGGTPGVPAAAGEALKALGPMPDLALMAEGEDLHFLEVLNPKDMASNDQPPSGDRSEFKDIDRASRLAKHTGMIDRWRALQIQATREYVSLFRTPNNDMLDLANKCDALDEKLSKPDDDAHAFRKIGAPPWSNTIEIIARQLSKRRVLAQAAAVLGTGGKPPNFPDTLPLTGIAARDPLGKGPLHFTHSATGFTIYGVGPHGIDHGGIPRGQDQSDEAYDIVFTYRAR